MRKVLQQYDICYFELSYNRIHVLVLQNHHCINKLNVDKNATCPYGHAHLQVDMIHMYLSCIKGAEIYHHTLVTFD